MQVPMHWRRQPQMRGPEWGQRRTIRADRGEWELPLEAEYNGRAIKIGYLNMVDEVTGRGRVSQVRVKDRTIPLVGNVSDVARGSLRRLMMVEGLNERPGAVTELALFLTGVHHGQMKDENEWVMSGGRGKLDIVSVREDPVDAVEKAIMAFSKADVISEGVVAEMLGVVLGYREVETYEVGVEIAQEPVMESV